MYSNCYMTIGPPGTGKTTDLVKNAARAAELYGGDKVMICSLTKTAAYEVRSRGIALPHSSIGTFHSHCHRLLGRPEIAQGHLKEWNERHPMMQLSGRSDDPDDSGEAMSGPREYDGVFNRYTIARARLQPRESWAWDVAQFARKWEEWKAETGYLDFEDLIEIASRDYDRAPGNPYVIYADEAQDFSASEVYALKKWSEHCKVVFSGDLDQTLFQFRGASPRAFYDLQIPATQKRVLETSYRVPQQVLETSLKWVRQIHSREDVVYKPRGAEGEVVRAPHLHFRDPLRLLLDAQKHLDAGKSVMFLGACGFHVEPIVTHLRAEGIPFHNPYAAHNGRWNPLAQRAGTSSTDRLMAYLAAREKGRWELQDILAWVEVISSDVLSRGAKKRLDEWKKAENPIVTDEDISDLFATEEDQRAALSAAWQGDTGWFQKNLLASKAGALEFPLRAYGRVGEQIKQEPKVVVGTVHSVKGGQCDVVYLCPALSRAGYENWVGPRDQKDMIYRLFYVAMTRAYETLVLCGDMSPMKVEWN
jgi:DNA helicase II / ATP-dependent DNA helicase PcrA